MATPASHAPTATPGTRASTTVVTLLYLDHCPNWPLASEHLRAAIARVGPGDIRVDWKPVHTISAARTAGFAGSPTILVDGVDPFPRPAHIDGLCCRFYDTESGSSGAPSVDQLVAALLDGRGAP